MKTIKENKYFIFDSEVVLLKYIIKRVLCSVFNIFYKIILFVYRPHFINNKKHNLSICAIFKDEASYIKEWIDYHLLVGVDHFYLYNNNSSDDYSSILKPYIEKGLVTLEQWPYTPGQMSAYYDCIENNRNDSNWISFIDLDEFIVPQKKSNINDVLVKFKRRPFVVAYWKYFGASGKINRESEYVIEDFVISTKKTANIGKCFYNTKYKFYKNEKLGGYMHLMYSKVLGITIPPVNVNDKFIVRSIHIGKKNNEIIINHYVTKSLSEYLDKKSKRGGGVHTESFHTMNYFNEHNLLCTEPNYSIYRFLIIMKEKEYCLARKKEDGTK